MCRGKRWSKPDNVLNRHKLPSIHIAPIVDEEQWLVEYVNGDVEIVTIRSDNFRDRALIQGDKNMNRELESIACVYCKYIRPLQDSNEAKGYEYVVIKKVVPIMENNKRGEPYFTYTAVDPRGLTEARVNLFDVIGRLVSSSPFHKDCGTDWFTYSDLHTSLFLEADDIMCSTACNIERKVHKIYYLTHFVNSSSQIRSMFKLDTQYNKDKIEMHHATIYARDEWTFKDYNEFGIINELEYKVLSMKADGFKEFQIASALNCSRRDIQNIMHDVKNKFTTLRNNYNA